MDLSSFLNFYNSPGIDTIPGEKDRICKMHRDDLLRESDWTQFNDSPLSEQKKSEWATYRQALRDVPQQDEYPDNIIWSIPPS
jgi:hypothetical protein